MSVAINGTNGITYNDGSLQSSAIGKNLIINGNMAINQRGVTGTVSLSAGAYGHDRFKAGASGATYTFATTANVTTITITAGSLQQVVEGLNIQSGTHTLSWTGTAQGKIDAGSYSASGVTGTLTGGTNATVEFNTGTLTNVQLEEGTTATPFEHLQYGQQLALCLRYLPVVQATNYVATGMCFSATNARCSVQFPVPSRVSPTGFTTTGAISMTTNNGSGTGSIVWANASTLMASLSATGLSGLVAGDATALIGNQSILFTGCEL